MALVMCPQYCVLICDLQDDGRAGPVQPQQEQDCDWREVPDRVPGGGGRTQPLQVLNLPGRLCHPALRQLGREPGAQDGAGVRRPGQSLCRAL